MIKGKKFLKEFDDIEISDYDSFLGLLKYRRSIRGFQTEPLPHELIRKLLEASRWAPSAGNAQPWEFIVIEDKKTIQKLADLYEYQMVEKKWLERTLPKKMRMFQGETFPNLDENNSINEALKAVKGKAPFRKAPCIIFPIADERWNDAFPLRTKLDKGRQHLIGSMANTVFALHLAAASLKLATQWISDFGSPWLSGMTRALLDIPEYYIIYEPIAVGYPTFYPKPRFVKNIDELIHYGEYDHTKARSNDEIREFIMTNIRPKLKFKI